MQISEKINSLTKEQLEVLIATVNSMTELSKQLNISMNFHVRKKLKAKISKHNIDISHFRKVRRYTIDQLIEATQQSSTYSEICRILDITVCTQNFKHIQLLHERHNISFDGDQIKKREGYNVDKEAINSIIKECLCIKDVLQKLNISINSHSYKAINKLIDEFNIDITHFDANKAFSRNKFHWDADTLLIKNSTADRSTIRLYMKKHHFTGRCSECGIGEMYNNKFLRLELDHINGDSTDNRLENLRWLCPNCHSQTSTFKKGKKGKKGYDI